MDMEIEKQYRELDKEERDIIDSKQIISLLQKNCYQLSNARKFKKMYEKHLVRL